MKINFDGRRELKDIYQVGNGIKDITFTEIESVSEHNNERGSLALEINYLVDVKTGKRAKNIFVLTNNNVIGYKIVYESPI